MSKTRRRKMILANAALTTLSVASLIYIRWIPRFAFVILAAGMFVTRCHAVEQIAWGAAENGVRVGIVLGPTRPQPTIRVVFENMASTETGVLVGGRTALGTTYNLAFTAIAPNGQKHKLLIGGGGGVVGGYLVPIVLRISSGTTNEVTLSLNRLFYVIRPRKTASLDTLLRERYSVCVSLEVTQKDVAWTRGSDPAYRSAPLWTGLISSAQLVFREDGRR